MPVVTPSRYQPPWFLRNAHVQSIVPTLFRRAGDVRVPGFDIRSRGPRRNNQTKRYLLSY